MSAKAKSRIYLSSFAVITCGAVLFAALCWVPPASSTATPPEPSIYQQLQDLRAARQFEEARALAVDFLETDPPFDLTRQQVEYEHAMTFFDARQFAAAREAFETFIEAYSPDEFDANDPAVVLDDSWFTYGVALLCENETQAGIDRLESLRAVFPGSNVRTRALQYTNRGLMNLEGRDWMPAEGVYRTGSIDNQETILANVEIIASEAPSLDVLAATFLDLLNYWDVRSCYRREPGEVCAARRIALVDRLVALAPEARMTKRALLEKAIAIQQNSPDTAMNIVDGVLAWAQGHDDESLLSDAQFTKAGVYVSTHDEAAARALYKAILQRPQSPIFEADLLLCTALSLQRAGDHASATELLNDLIISDEYGVDARATALFARADNLRCLGRWAEAAADLGEAARLRPGTATAQNASQYRETLVGY